MRAVLFILVCAVVAYVASTFFFEFAKASGTTWERLLSASRDSVTILVSKVAALSSGLLVVADQSADLLDLAPVKDFIAGLMKPQWVALFGAVFALLVYFARRRSLK